VSSHVTFSTPVARAISMPRSPISTQSETGRASVSGKIVDDRHIQAKGRREDLTVAIAPNIAGEGFQEIDRFGRRHAPNGVSAFSDAISEKGVGSSDQFDPVLRLLDKFRRAG
jgi:hypothetical protein